MGILKKFIQKITGNEEETTSSSSKSTSNKKNRYANISKENPYTTSSGKTYTSPVDYVAAVHYAKTHQTDDEWFNNQLQQRQTRRQKREEYNQKYAEEHTSERGKLDRILGVLGYGGIAQGLYNLTDDDEDTTFLGGLKEGLHYMNPFTDDVSGRKTMSDVLKNIGWEDDDPDHLSLSDVGRGVVGFVGDVLTDPLSFVNPFGSAGKVVKGSGYGLDAVKGVKAATHSKSFAEVSKYLENASGNADKLKYMKGTTADDFIKAASYDKSLSKEEIQATAERMSDYFNKDIQRLRINTDAEEGLSLGIGHLLPFDEKRRKALNKEIISSKSLRQLGDSTISPYYNSLTKKIRTSKMGQRFSKRNQLESIGKSEGMDKIINMYSASRMVKGFEEAAKDSKDYDTAQQLYTALKDMDDGEVMELLTDIEDGWFSDLRSMMDIKEKAFNKAYKKISDNEYERISDGARIQKTQDEIMGEINFSEQIGEFENTKSLLQQKREVLDVVEDFVNKNKHLITDEFTSDMYRLTGKTYNKNSSSTDLAEALTLYNRYKNSDGWSNILKNMKTDDMPETVKKAYDKLLSNADDATAKRVALNADKEKLQTAISKAAREYEEKNNADIKLFDDFDKYVKDNQMRYFLAFEGRDINYDEALKFVKEYTQHHLNNYYKIKNKYGGGEMVDVMITQRQYLGKELTNARKKLNELNKKYNVKSREKDKLEWLKNNKIPESDYPHYLEVYNTVRITRSEYRDQSCNLVTMIEDYIDEKSNSPIKIKYETPEYKLNQIKQIEKEINDIDNIDSLYKTDFVRPDLGNMTKKDMLEIAKSNNIKGLTKLRKEEVKNRLNQYYDNKMMQNVTEEGWNKIIEESSPADLQKLLNNVSNDAEYQKLNQWLDKNKSLEERINDFETSEAYEFFKDCDHLMTDKLARDIGNDRVGQYLEELPTITDRLNHIGGIVDLFKRGEVTQSAYDKATLDAVNVFMDRMDEVAKLEIAAGVLGEDGYVKYRERYIPHILKNKDALASAIIEKTNGSFKQYWQFASRGFGKLRKSNMIVDAVDDSGERIFKTALWDIYLERCLNSNQLLANKKITSFVNDLFSKPLKNNLDGAEEGYVKGIFYEDLQKHINRQTSHVLRSEQKHVKWELAENYRNNPEAFLDELRKSGALPEHLEANIRTAEKRVKQVQELLSKNLDESGFAHYSAEQRRKYGEYNKPYVPRSDLEKQLTEAMNSVTAAHQALDNHVSKAINEAAEGWAETFKKEIQQSEYDKIVTKIFGDENEAGRIKFSANNAITIMTDDEIRRLEEVLGEVELRQYDSNIIDITNRMSKMQQAKLQPELLNLYDGFLKHWKLANTLVSPSFHVQNAASNAFQSFLSIGADALNPSMLKTAKNILSTDDPYQTITINGEKYTYQKLNRLAKKYGVVDENFATYDFGKDKPTRWELGQRNADLQSFKDVKLTINPWSNLTQASTIIGSNLETVQRMNLFLGRLKQGDDVEEAARKVDQFLFDYSDLTEFEQNTMKRVIPFYTFMRKNIPMELEAMLNTPSIFRNLNYGFDEFEKMDESTVPENKRNEWRQDYVSIPYSRNLTGTSENVGINPNLPYQQLDRLELDKILGSTSPLIKAPLELYTGQYAYTGMDIDNLGEYLLGQTAITSPVARYIESDDKDEQVMREVSKYTSFPIATIKDQTVNKYSK